MKKIIFVLSLVMLLLACNQSKSKVSRYYKATNWDRNCPRFPLYEPLAIYKDRSTPPKWHLSFNDFQSSRKDKIDYHTAGSNIISIHHIGIDRGIVHGYIKESELIETGAGIGNYAFINSKGGFSFSLQKCPTGKNEQALLLIDSTKKSFLIPKRWYVVNTRDTTYTYLFSEEDYQTRLKELNVSAHMYNIDSVYNQFVRGGILPWFPDSIKAVLNK
ncbi:MAG: hypothetical protein COC06_07910 [Bacteroidales bacterium]|nr:MAG: hypothetical protein COC06_07910 [Bacteroidales bacterium]